MLQPTDEEIKTRLRITNEWWGPEDKRGILASTRKLPKRAYFPTFVAQVKNTSVQRAIVLMGPRRVGKTVMLRQAIQSLIDDGIDPKTILYASLETPIYIGLGLEKIFTLFCDIHRHKLTASLFVFFDEVQYLKNWEVHLKSLVDSFPNTKVVVSGSAAAALRWASNESGAGRFSDFVLPPLSFSEFLKFSTTKREYAALLGTKRGSVPNIAALNEKFIDFLNYGGFPEAILNKSIKQDFQRFIGEDVLSKVMLRDLPSLYGIDDPQEINQFFSLVAFNTGTEINLETLSQKSGVALNTVKKYLQYLEAAFLIRRVERIDKSARRFKRVATMKIYLTNPCLRAALFEPVVSDSPAMGSLVETAMFAAFFEGGFSGIVKYARWEDGEIDFVSMRSDGVPIFAVECKWSDSFFSDDRGLAPYVAFAIENRLEKISVTSKSTFKNLEIDGVHVEIVPISSYIEMVGDSTSKRLNAGRVLGTSLDGAPFFKPAPPKPSA
jgi:hypothetical protein